MTSGGRWAVPAAAVALAVACGLGGCAAGPDYQRPALKVDRYLATPLPERTAEAPGPAGGAQRIVAAADIPADWWRLFRSPALDRLVTQGLAANPTVEAADAALRIALANVAAQRGGYYPTVQAGLAPTRQKNPVGTLAPTLASGQAVYTLYTGQVTVSYLPDVFGVNRRQVESALAQAEAAKFQLQAARLALCANLASAAIQEASLRAQIRATLQLIDTQAEQLGVLQRQYGLGAIAQADVVAQEAALAQIRAGLPALYKQLAAQRDAIAVLVGRAPADMPDETFALDDLALPPELPVAVPASLVERRPDVRAAEAQLKSASAQVGVAVANLLPQVTLTAAYGGASTGLSRLLASENAFWSLGAGLAQTLFDGGTLRARKRATVAGLDQAGALYRAAVLNAFQNVADALEAVTQDAAALQAEVAAEDAAFRSLTIARRSYELGASSYLAVLNAQQAYQQAVLARAQFQANRYSDTVALFQALGGGWAIP
jgi:NodT family efflux transporter outer membrane factor (OMF) lipoprotein